jgi:hypothetical protein
MGTRTSVAARVAQVDEVAAQVDRRTACTEPRNVAAL